MRGLRTGEQRRKGGDFVTVQTKVKVGSSVLIIPD